jgi:hypothetical protein
MLIERIQLLRQNRGNFEAVTLKNLVLVTNSVSVRTICPQRQLVVTAGDMKYALPAEQLRLLCVYC